MTQAANERPTVDLYYATDPLCSFCWAFEPTLLKFRYQYKRYLADDTILMGGMIPSWDTFGGTKEMVSKKRLMLRTIGKRLVNRPECR